MPVCPDGHNSNATDYCDVCGLPMQPQNQTELLAAVQQCPVCGALSDEDAFFCESCGYDFTTGALSWSTQPPAPVMAPEPGAAPVPEEAPEPGPAPEPEPGPPAPPEAVEAPSSSVSDEQPPTQRWFDLDLGEEPAAPHEPQQVAPEPEPVVPEPEPVMIEPEPEPEPVVPEPEPEPVVPEPAPERVAPAPEPMATAVQPPVVVSPADQGEPDWSQEPTVALEEGKTPPPVVAPSPPPTPPQPPLRWVVEVWIDPDWYRSQSSAVQLPSPGLPRIVTLTGQQNLIGRESRSRNVHPDVDCDPDTGVSRRQAMLSTDGSRWYVEDLGSSNGTYLGQADEPLPTVPISGRTQVSPDDRIYVGSWTRLVVRPALPSEANL